VSVDCSPETQCSPSSEKAGEGESIIHPSIIYLFSQSTGASQEPQAISRVTNIL
jgi:hypothetical protein